MSRAETGGDNHPRCGRSRQEAVRFMGSQRQPQFEAGRTPSFTPAHAALLQRRCACGGSAGLSGECEECGREKLLQRRAAAPAAVPAVVHEVLRSPGAPLDVGTRNLLEPRFGHDFSQVRVHTDAKAARSSQVMHALAYTVGQEVVFGPGRYSPGTVAGKSLLAHELAHVVQQAQGPGLGDAEPRADAAAERVVRGGSVTPEMVGGASPGLHAEGDEEEARTTPTVEPAFSLSWDALARPGRRPLTLGVPTLPPPSPGLRPPAPLTPLPSTALPGLTPPFTPPSQTSAGSPKLPSRVSVLNSGQFSLGLRLGFPEVEAQKIPDAPPSALQESLRRATVMEQMLTGTVPEGWDAIDKAQLATAIWGIFSERIAPDLARNITRGLSAPTGPGGASFELDVVLLTDFSGGGLSFTVRH